MFRGTSWAVGDFQSLIPINLWGPWKRAEAKTLLT